MLISHERKCGESHLCETRQLADSETIAKHVGTVFLVCGAVKRAVMLPSVKNGFGYDDEE